MKKHIVLSLTMLCAACLLAGCSTVDMPKGSGDGYSSARFIKVKDYPMKGASKNKALNNKIQQAISAEMESHGIKMTESGGELIIAYMLVIQDNVSTKMINDYYGMNSDGDEIADKAHGRILEGTDRESFERGAIIIDVIDGGNDKLIYRNFAVRNILDDASEQTRKKRIQEAVSEALADFFK